MFVVFDLDRTLANCSHREHYLAGGHKDWDGFFAAARRDKPIETTLEIMRLLYGAGHRLEIWTARPDAYRNATAQWLKLAAGIKIAGDPLAGIFQPRTILINRLLMRPAEDRRDDTEIKREWLDTVRKIEGVVPDLVFEDRSRLVDMYRAEGVTCYQVDHGDF